MSFEDPFGLPSEAEIEAKQLRDDLVRLTAENERLENLTASGIHTCNADCQRPMCVLRRERDKAHADLARMTAERDHAQGITEKLPNVSVPQPCQMRAELAEASLKVASEQISALRARVAELEKEAMILRGTVEAVTTQRQQAEQRNAELVAALRMAVNELQRVTVVTDGHPSVSYNLMYNLRQVLGRAESATPDAAECASDYASQLAEDKRNESAERMAGIQSLAESATPAKQEAAR